MEFGGPGLRSSDLLGHFLVRSFQPDEDQRLPVLLEDQTLRLRHLATVGRWQFVPFVHCQREPVKLHMQLHPFRVCQYGL